MTQSQLVWSFESQSWVKVKVVKWCRKKWNEHNLMYIYHKQCEIKQKNHWNSSNGQIHWFPIDFLWKWSIMDQNYANANAFFSDWNIFLRYPGYTIWKLTSRAFWKCGSFCCYNFLNPSYGWSKLGQISKKKSCWVKAYKKITRLQFCVSSFHIESALAQ